MALHGRIEHRLQGMIRSPCEVIGRPFGQRVPGLGRSSVEVARRQLPQSTVQVFDDVEVGDQGRSLAVEPSCSFAPELMSSGSFRLSACTLK